MKRGSGKITWGHIGKTKTYKHALQTERPNLSPEDRKRIIGQKMTPYDSAELNIKAVFVGAAPYSGTPTPSPTPTATPVSFNCDWTGITEQFGYNTNDWSDCQPVPVVSPSSTPTNTPTPSVTRTPDVTPTSTPTPTPSRPATGGFIDYFDAATYEGDGDWNSLTTTNRFRLVNSPAKISDFGGMIQFDGVDDYGISNAQLIPGFYDWSMEFWYRFQSASCSYSQNNMFVDGRLATANSINFRDNRDCFGNLGWQFTVGSSGTSINPGVNVPAQVVYSYSGSGNLEVFVNGSLIYSDSGYTHSTNINRLNLLATNDANKPAVDWAIIKTYPFALNSSQVLDNFNQLKSRFGL